MGIIDPAGFDTNQRKNSFEQLIFNIVNEHIAYHYNEYTFNKEIVSTSTTCVHYLCPIAQLFQRRYLIPCLKLIERLQRRRGSNRHINLSRQQE